MVVLKDCYLVPFSLHRSTQFYIAFELKKNAILTGRRSLLTGMVRMQLQKVRDQNPAIVPRKVLGRPPLRTP